MDANVSYSRHVSGRSSKLTRVVVVAFVAVSSVGFISARNPLVTVDPTFGRHTTPVRIFMTPAEVATVRRMPAEISSLGLGVAATAAAARWMVESTAVGSETLELSRRVLDRLQALFERLGLVRVSTTYVVIGRTQKFINDSLASLDCYPNLVRTGGVHLMGASLCNRRVIVINLTGYFFLRRAGDELTTAMEVLAEPPINSLNYRIADRNISGLAHEWAHIARASETDGFVAPDEPAWMREGFAELMAGIAHAYAFPRRLSYLRFHVVRLRKFADWGNYCTEPLRRYRQDSDLLAGCEYYLGALSVEYLVARMGGLETLIELLKKSSRLMNFEWAFRTVYGMSLDTFEAKMDSYLGAIADLPDP